MTDTVPFARPACMAVPRRRAWLLPALLGVVVAFPLVLMAAGAWWSHREVWAGARRDLGGAADTAAEYAARVLGSHRLTAELVNTMLAGLSDAEIRAREVELHARLRDLLPLVPMAATIALSDGNADMLVTANVMPVPRVNIADREWVQALRQPGHPPIHVSAVTTGRVDKNFFFGVSIRRALAGNGVPPGGFDGVVNIAVNPNMVAKGLEALVRHPQDIVTLLRADGEILARSAAMSVRMPPVPASSRLRMLAAEGARSGSYVSRSLGIWAGRETGQELLVAFRQVGDLPVYATVSRPTSAIAAQWREAVATQLAIGLPAMAGLVGLVAMVRRGQRDLAASETEFRAAFERSPLGKAQVEVASGRFLRVNDCFAEITGYAKAELTGGMTFSDVTHPEDRAANLEGFRKAMAESGMYRTEKRYVRKDGEVAWVEVSTALIPGRRKGEPARTIAAVQDVTDRRAAAARQSLLAREVDHRAKNVLAVVQSIVRLTRADDPKMFASIVEGRVRALARAHELLAREGWRGADLREVVSREVAAFASADRVVLDGVPVHMGTHLVQPLSMVLHELATNAARHGALSVPEGRVAVSWALDGGGERRLLLTWVERGGPALAGVPQRTGFGHRLIEATVADQLRGTVALDWEPGGLRCRLSIPGVGAARAAGPPEGAASPGAGEEEKETGATLRGRRILVVEDEPLVAMDLSAALAAIGCEVVGPIGTLKEAVSLARSEIVAGRLDGAVLDVNLGGVMSLPLAELLREAGIPVVFATGYSELEAGNETGAAFVLRKPVAPAELEAGLRRAIGMAGRSAGGAARCEASGA